MNDYRVAREKQERLYKLYHQWYNIATAPGSSFATHLNVFRGIFRDETRVLQLLRRIHSTKDIKEMLYKEIRRRTTRKRLAWHRYQDHLRFNLFCISVYRKTRVDVSFARHSILEYLHGRVLKSST